MDIVVNLKCSELGALLGKNRYCRDVDGLKKEYIAKAIGKKCNKNIIFKFRENLKRQNPMLNETALDRIIDKYTPEKPTSIENIKETIEIFKGNIISDSSLDSETKKTVLDFVRSKINTDWGTDNERNSIDNLRKLEGYSDLIEGGDVPGKFSTQQKEFININGIKFNIRGRLDAYLPESNTVIEIKNRVNSRFVLEPHEMIQLCAYMFLYEAEKGLLIQDHNGTFNITELYYSEWSKLDKELKDVCFDIARKIKNTLYPEKYIKRKYFEIPNDPVPINTLNI